MGQSSRAPHSGGPGAVGRTAVVLPALVQQGHRVTVRLLPVPDHSTAVLVGGQLGLIARGRTVDPLLGGRRPQRDAAEGKFTYDVRTLKRGYPKSR